MMPTARTGRRGAAAVLTALLVLAAAAPVAASPEERRLQETKERLDRVRAELSEAREERDAEAAALEVATERVEEVLSAVGEAELAVERQELAVADAEEHLSELLAEVDARQSSTQDRIRALYMQGGENSVASLLAAGSTQEALSRTTLLDVVNRNDRVAFESVSASQRAVDAQAEHLQEERAALERVLERQEELLAEVEELREDQAIAAAEAEAEVDELEQHAAYLEEETRELAAASRRSARAERTSRSAGGGGSSSGEQPAQSSGSSGEASSGSGGGGWQWPAQGRVTSEYGTRWGRLHAGIDVANSTGTAVVASRGGRVTHAGSMSGYGNTVLIDHGGGIVTVYAHLNSIAVGTGQQVGSGQRIGGMGCSGSCTGTHVHFEVRVNGNAQNPRGYLP